MNDSRSIEHKATEVEGIVESIVLAIQKLRKKGVEVYLGREVKIKLYKEGKSESEFTLITSFEVQKGEISIKTN